MYGRIGDIVDEQLYRGVLFSLLRLYLHNFLCSEVLMLIDQDYVSYNQ